MIPAKGRTGTGKTMSDPQTFDGCTINDIKSRTQFKDAK